MMKAKEVEIFINNLGTYALTRIKTHTEIYKKYKDKKTLGKIEAYRDILKYMCDILED